MPARKNAKAVKLEQTDMKIELIETVDKSPEAEARSANVQNLVSKMILLGNKKGRPKERRNNMKLQRQPNLYSLCL